jgi:F-type H+-transporting ATPase subunit b
VGPTRRSRRRHRGIPPKACPKSTVAVTVGHSVINLIVMGPLEPNSTEMVLGLPCLFLILGVLGRVLLPRIETVMAERDDAMEGGLKRAEAARSEAESVRADFQGALREARHEAARIRQTASEEGTALIEAVRDEGRQQRDRMLAKAHTQLAADRIVVEAELHEYVIGLATELAGRIVGEPLDASRARATAERYFADRESAAVRSDPAA